MRHCQLLGTAQHGTTSACLPHCRVAVSQTAHWHPCHPILQCKPPSMYACRLANRAESERRLRAELSDAMALHMASAPAAMTACTKLSWQASASAATACSASLRTAAMLQCISFAATYGDSVFLRSRSILPTMKLATCLRHTRLHKQQGRGLPAHAQGTKAGTYRVLQRWLQLLLWKLQD